MTSPVSQDHRDPIATRGRLLDAALALFTERTLTGTAVPAVAARAGVGVGTIYRSYPSKEALGNAVYQRCKADMRAALSRGQPTDPTAETARTSLRRLWHNLASFAAEQPDALAFCEHQQHASYLDEHSRLAARNVEDLVIAAIRRGQLAGEIRQGDPWLLVSLAYGAFVGMTKSLRAVTASLDAATVEAAEQAVWDMLCAR